MTSVPSKIIIKNNFYTKVHGVVFSLRPEEAVLLDSESLSARNKYFL